MTFTPRVVAAIDFGTHGSGFAWAVKSRLNDDPLTRKVTFFTRYASARVAYPKNLTAVLADKDDHVVAWGHEARAQWAAASDSGNPDRLGYAYAFKMALTDEDANAGMPTTGGSMSLADRGRLRRTVTSYLREIRKAALADITATGEYTEPDIRWCITSPAIWDEPERNAMRRAAYDAGFPEDDERLLLSVEPEAAALYCQLRLAGLADGSGKGEKLGLDNDGSRFMVVNCGGGTVDITAYEASSRAAQPGSLRRLGTLDEIGVATGGRLGSEYINHAFRVTVLAERFGAEAMRRFEQENAADLLQLSEDWEQAKITARVERGPDGVAHFIDPVVIAIPPAIWTALDAAARARLAGQAQGKPQRLVLRPDEVEALFDTVISALLSAIEEQLANIRRTCGEGVAGAPGTIILVGGLAMSGYVREAVRRRFGAEHRILVPPSPALAVLEGAVHYAYDPQAFASRRSKYTYGFALAMPWEAGRDSPMRKFRDRHQAMMCRDRFEVAVRRLDRVAVDEPFPFVVEPTFTDSPEVAVQLFKTRAADPRYVDEDGSELVGELAVDVSETVGQAERPLALLFYFGRSQIQVTALDLTTNKKFEAAIDFEQMVLALRSAQGRDRSEMRAAAAGQAHPGQRPYDHLR
jgi:molecular chaperone DnaK (HSP70)